MGKIIHNSDGSVTRTSSTGRKFTYKFQQGGETESQKQKRLYEEMQKLPEPKISEDTHYDEVRKEWVPSMKAKSDTLFVSNPNDPRLKAYEDSLSLYNQSKALQDYYRTQGYELGKASYSVPDDYIDVVNKKMSETKERFKREMAKSNDSDAIFGHNTWGVPWLFDKGKKIYNRGNSSNILERMVGNTDGSEDVWGEEPYRAKANEMLSKLNNIPRGFTGTLDMYNNSFMDADAPVQYLSPTIKPTLNLSASGTGHKKGNYDEVFTYDLAKIKPTQPVAYRNYDNLTWDELYELSSKKNNNEVEAETFNRDPGDNIHPQRFPGYQISHQPPKMTPKGQTEVPQYKIPKPDIKRRYYQENGKYYMDFPDSKSKNQTIKRPISKETYRLGLQEQDEDLGIRTRYRNAGRIKKSC